MVSFGQIGDKVQAGLAAFHKPKFGSADSAIATANPNIHATPIHRPAAHIPATHRRSVNFGQKHKLIPATLVITATSPNEKIPAIGLNFVAATALIRVVTIRLAAPRKTKRKRG